MKALRKSDEAVVGIVVTVLLIGLALSVVVMINTAFVPQWLEEAEAAHMEEVSSQFAQLKYATDLQATLRQRTAISSSIRLGISNLPILSTGRTFGSLGISEHECNISIQHESGFLNFTVGNIKFSSGNSYFVRQDYILESGALIVAQHPHSMLMGKPIFLATYAEFPFDGRISFTIINTTTSFDKSFISGQSTYPIHTEFITSNQYQNLNLSKITVISQYPNAWRAVFESTLKRSDNPYNANLVHVAGNTVLVDFNEYEGSGATVCDIRYVEILAQIAPGWIE